MLPLIAILAAASGQDADELPLELAQRTALLEGVIARAREVGAVGPGLEEAFGWTWESDLGRVRQMNQEATSEQDFRGVLEALANSLHNPHAVYEPAGRGELLLLDLAFACAYNGGQEQFYVETVSDGVAAMGVAPGDLVVSYDGVAAEDLLASQSLISGMNHPRALCHDVARLLGRRSTTRSRVVAQAEVALEIQPRLGGDPISFKAVWTPRSRNRGEASDQSLIDYSDPSCANLPERQYPGYSLAGLGYGYCVYLSRERPYRRYPIVRQHSFQYRRNARGPWDIRQLVRMDQQRLLGLLERQRGISAVIVDLRDNGGGNNPNWFLDWWAPGPYIDQFLELPRRPDLVSEGRLADVGLFGVQAEAYVRLGGGEAGDAAVVLPAFPRGAEAEWDNVYVPLNRVTKAPVVLLTGWECASACDGFVAIMDEFDFAPLVGAPPMGGSTMLLEGIRIALPEEEGDHGYINLPFSRELSGRTGLSQEGRPAKVDVLIERTFENRESYDALLVDAAIEASKDFDYQVGVDPGPQ